MIYVLILMSVRSKKTVITLLDKSFICILSELLICDKIKCRIIYLGNTIIF